MASSTKRRMTQTKMAREQALRERRAKKAEKKEIRKQEGTALPADAAETLDPESAPEPESAQAASL